MNNNSTNTELLIRYLDLDLAPNELIDVNRRLQEDNSLAHELEFLRYSQEAVAAYGLRKQVADIHVSMMQEFNRGAVKVPPRGALVRWILQVAAVLFFVIAGTAVYYYFSVSKENLLNEAYLPYSIGTERDVAGLSAIEEAYKNKAYDEVISLSKQAPPSDLNAGFFAGLSYLEKGDVANAIPHFEKIVDANSKAGTQAVYPDDSEFYLAMSYLKNNDPERALPIFEKIHHDKLHRYYDKVSSAFIRKLKLLKWKMQ
jgi:tetratricopeptide (TPR) repeat protein